MSNNRCERCNTVVSDGSLYCTGCQMHRTTEAAVREMDGVGGVGLMSDRLYSTDVGVFALRRALGQWSACDACCFTDRYGICAGQPHTDIDCCDNCDVENYFTPADDKAKVYIAKLRLLGLVSK